MWRLMPGQRLRSRSWDGEEFVLYNNLSGDTHLLDAASIEVLNALQRGAAGTAGLAAALQLDSSAPSPQPPHERSQHGGGAERRGRSQPQHRAVADNSPKNHFGALVFSRFLDRDGDGFITLDDISTVQALMMQKSHHFVKMIFRLYSEVLWYPGRQLNIMNMIQGTSVGANAANANAAASPLPSPPSVEAAPTTSNKFSSIFSGLKKDKEEKHVDF
eukprot:gene28839-32571_t